MPRWAASLVPLSIAMIVVFAALAVVVPLIADDLLAFISRVPTYIDYVEKALTTEGALEGLLSKLPFEVDIIDVKEKLYAYSDQITTIALNTLSKAALGAMAIFDLLSLLIITPLVVFYLLADWKKVSAGIQSIIPSDMRTDSCRIFGKIDASLSAFIRGQLSVCVILGLFYGIALSLSGLQLGFFIGMITGLLSFIPFVGMGLGLASALVMAVVQYQFDSFTPYLIIAGIFAVGQILEGFVLTPKLVGSKVGLHPVWVIFAIMAGGELGGFVGMLIALPVMTVINVILPEVVKYWFKQRENTLKSK
jgi:predicted PurR-regulated permease PerM